MSIFALKLIACFTMVLDHIKYAIPETNGFITTYLGRLSYPLFAFLITEGYVHTKDLKRYYKRLLIFAIISQLPFMLFRTLVGEYLMLNILFTLLLGLISITIFDKVKKKWISIPLCLLVIFLGKLLNVDYDWYGVTTVFVIYLFRQRKILQFIGFSLLTFIHYYTKGLFYNVSTHILLSYSFTISSIFLIWLYNGKLGKKVKYFYYWFYPIHMLIVYFLKF